MTMLSVVPQEFFDEVATPSAVTLDGELLGALDDAPAGPWLAQMLDRVDRSRLTTLELPTYLRACSRMRVARGPLRRHARLARCARSAR